LRVMFASQTARAVGHIERQSGAAMDWVVHYFDRRLGRVSVSRQHSSKQSALRQACDLLIRQCEIYYIQGPQMQRLQAPVVYAWCKANRTAERPSDPD
jgi:hypothetical protein